MARKSGRYSNITRAGLFLAVCLLFGCMIFAPVSDASEAGIRQQPGASHYTTYEGIRVHYIEAGAGDRAIVFVHGWCGDASVWRHQMNYFRKKYRVIAVDLPGHGKSGKPRIDYTFDLYAGAVRKVMDAAGVRRACLVVHSMGLLVARHFIENYPNVVSRLCIVDGAAIAVPENREDRTRWKKRADADLAAATWKNRSAFIDSLFSKQTPPALKKKIRSMMLKTPEYVAESTMKNMLNPGNWRKTPTSVYVLAVYAATPDLPAHNAADLHRMFPLLTYYQVKGAGHFIMLEAPDRFNRLLYDYLSHCPCNSVKVR